MQTGKVKLFTGEDFDALLDALGQAQLADAAEGVAGKGALDTADIVLLVHHFFDLAHKLAKTLRGDVHAERICGALVVV